MRTVETLEDTLFTSAIQRLTTQMEQYEYLLVNHFSRFNSHVIKSNNDSTDMINHDAINSEICEELVKVL